METITVKLKGLEVELEVTAEDGISYIDEVLTTETISEEVAEFLFDNHLPDLSILAQNQFDEAIRMRGTASAILHHELDMMPGFKAA